jgi:isocitrate dehydrogenase kinase/phosphatase
LSDILLKTIIVNFDVNYRQFKETSFVAQMNAAALHWWAKQKNCTTKITDYWSILSKICNGELDE